MLKWLLTLVNPVEWYKSVRPVTPEFSRYEEICKIKDRLYRDMVRLEALQGRQMASDNVKRIMLEVLATTPEAK